MFSGIIECTGKIKNTLWKGRGKRLITDIRKIAEEINIGDSIAVDGVCLTVAEKKDALLFFDVSPQTLNTTTLSYLKMADLVNIERALNLKDRINGHFVLGHVDGIGRIVKLFSYGDFYKLSVSIDKKLLKYVVKKGSVAVDGISLTIADIAGNSIEIAVIPYTFNNTNLKRKRIGDLVNIEIDILAKYVERSLQKKEIGDKFLERYSFIEET
ncbi:MAG: riboflavin synthase [Deltaproteobacteria bacterium]|nr:riboflavin synthase [Deltaproteobacteria bacterium]